MTEGGGFGPIGRADAPEEHLQEWTRLQVRAGLLRRDALLAEVVGAIESELSDLTGQNAAILARAWIGGAEAEHRRVAQGWSAPTDHDRLLAALDECAANGLLVVPGVDEAAAAEALRASSEPPRGLAWFTRDAVETAIRTGVLDLGLRRGDGSAVDEADRLTGAVLATLDKHGLRARWHEGRVQVATRWQRRP